MLEPLPESRWNFAMAGHLLNRAGFGGTREEIEALEKLGPEQAVERLVNPVGARVSVPAPVWAKPDPERGAKLRQLREATPEERRKLVRATQAEERRRTLELRREWIRRMVAAEPPLEEKMVLFWHGHFATSIRKVRDPWLMFRQLETFREHGMGSWSALLLAVTRDPAMLLWLDQARSRREHPNENYARELMELFALGEGHYSERDIAETARALTGLTYDPIAQQPVWRPRWHDPGRKTVLGLEGRLGPEEVVRHIAGRPQSSRFLARKLWTFFAREDPPMALVDALAEAFRAGGNEVRPLLRTLFRSREFYAPEVVRSQIKSPVQWLVMGLRQTRGELPPAVQVTAVLRDLGQDLLAPPNVKGWDGGRAWINTGTLTRRREYAARLAAGFDSSPRSRAMARSSGGPAARRERGGNEEWGKARVDRIFRATERSTRAQLVEAMERRLLQAPFRESLAASVRESLGDDEPPDPRAILEALRVVMQSTDYQLA